MMSPRSRPEVKDWHILILDIVDYSELDTDKQREAVNYLKKVMKKTHAYATTSRVDRMALPTGDGIAVAFRGDVPERPLMLAEDIHRAYGERRFSLKIGIDSGIAFPISDINGNRNMAGSGINFAARVLSCCSGGHILVGDQLARRLREIADYKTQLQNPHDFRVKHDKILKIWNFSNGKDVGNPADPVVNRQFEGDYNSLQQRLALRGIHPAADLAAPKHRHKLQAQLILGKVVLEGDIGGFTGVDSKHTQITMTHDATPLLPECVLQAKRELKEPGPNKPKAFLINWEAPIIDTGGILKLNLCSTDYWTTLAVEEARGKLQRDLLAGKFTLKTFPRRLNIAIVLVTADMKLVLCRRAKHLRYYGGAWSVIGETIDAEEDRDQAGDIRPEKTVSRALTEYDELHLPYDAVEDAEIRFIAITTNWEYLLADMTAFVKLRSKDFEFVRDCWTPGECELLDGIPFSPDRCLQMITAGYHEPSDRPGQRASVSDWSRMSILAALFSEFNYHRVMEGI
jgi:hypothetical protein